MSPFIYPTHLVFSVVLVFSMLLLSQIKHKLMIFNVVSNMIYSNSNNDRRQINIGVGIVWFEMKPEPNQTELFAKFKITN